MREAQEMSSPHFLGERADKINARSPRVQNRLSRAREQLALVSSTQALGFWRWNRKTDEVRTSKQARRILGLEARSRLTRTQLLSIIHPMDRERIISAVGATRNHRDIVEMELRVGQGACLRWVTAKVSARRDANGMIVSAVGYLVDEFNGKRTDAQFQKLQQQITHLTRVVMLGELSGAIAHELQQPLTATLSNAQTAQLLAAGADFRIDDLREILSDIIDDNQHAVELIQRLRSLLVRGEIQMQRVNVRDLVDKVLTLCRGTLMERRVQIELRMDAGIPDVLGDRVELQQVLLNLILNGSESMAKNAPTARRMEIAIVFDAPLALVRFSVLDRGKGIDPDQLERIFEPFFTTKEGGMGLGLAVSRSIVVAHQGRLWATRRAAGGAAFHFTLPIEATIVNDEPHGAENSPSCEG